MHDAIFVQPTRLKREDVTVAAQQIGLEVTEFLRCLDSELSPAIRSDLVLAQKLRARGTPALFLGTVTLDQMQVVRRFDGLVSTQALSPA